MNDFLQTPCGRTVEIDDKGYLLVAEDWSREVALDMARRDGLQLDTDHWVVLAIFRDYYQQKQRELPMRVLVQMARQRLGPDKGNSRYLYRLFPKGPATQSCRYAGLPQPESCI